MKMSIMQNGQFVMGDEEQIEIAMHALSDET